MSCQITGRTIFVKVGRVGKSLKELCVTEGITIGDILSMASEWPFNGDINDLTINGKVINGAFTRNTVSDKDLILIQPKVVLSPKFVKVGRLGETLMSVQMTNRMTIKNALIAAGRLPFENEDVWLHKAGDPKGTNVNGFMDSYLVVEGDILVIEQKKNLKTQIEYLVTKNLGSSYASDCCVVEICSLLTKKGIDCNR